jgi:ATP-binding cassette subfamily B protein
MSATGKNADRAAFAIRWADVWEIFHPWRRLLLAAVATVVAGAGIALLPPLIVRRLIDVNLKQGRMDGLLLMGLAYLGANIASQGASFLTGYTTTVAAQGALRRLRVRLFAHLQRLPVAYYDRTPIGDVISRCTADMETIDSLFSSGVISVVAEALRLVAALAAMIALSPALSLALLLALPLLVVITRQFQVRLRGAQRALRLAVGQLNARLQETLTRVEVVRAFHWEWRIVQRFRRVLAETLRVQNHAIALGAVYDPALNILQAALVAIFLMLSASPVLEAAHVTIGTLTAFVLLFDQFFGPLLAIGNDWQAVQGALAGVERVLQVLAMPTENADLPEGDHAPEYRRAPEYRLRSPLPDADTEDGALVRVEGVTFGYLADRPVLSDVSLRVMPGQHVAIVGRTGAGKSSLFQLLGGLYRPWEGRVRIAGRDPAEVVADERRRLIGAVPQVVWLYGGTVTDNLTLGDATMAPEAVAEAARIAGAESFIGALAAGYDTLISDAGRGKGVQLSGGQRQLLALARALVGSPTVLLLDEATAAVDSATEAALKQALRYQLTERQGAVVTIAHRLSTALEADYIVVLENGRIVEEGAPAELLQRGGQLASLWQLETAGWQWRANGN